jgi:hypothetical protein
VYNIKKMKFFCGALLLCLAISACYGDMYMHNLRGSNNRNREANTNRQNNNRLMDTQNNAKGGYCWGPEMSFYEGSLLSLEWTNQHGCGVNPKMYCNIVIQYMCGSKGADATHLIRDGASTDTPPTDATELARAADEGVEGATYHFGLHEPLEFYQACATRSRNMGLFIADREKEGGLGRGPATKTRQNNNGGRSGLECPEERDYYPYWHPSPWRDVAILTHNTDWCGFYKSESQNVKGRGHCVTKADEKVEAQQNNPTECSAAGNIWKEEKAWGIPAPDCVRAPLSRENHLGNGGLTFTNGYNWTLPTTSEESCIKKDDCNCVLRMRYNISTGDLGKNGNAPNSDFIDYKSNAENSPVKEDPIKEQDGNKFQLAIDTTQFGRTFEDRSYVFHIKPRPSGILDTARIYNLNVRGKRGNIVQTYPSTEYDFVPQNLYARVGDYIHFQWTGCDTNPAGNAGNGADGSDRSNIVQIESPDASHPASDEWMKKNTKLFPDKKTRVRMATLGQTNCKTEEELGGNNQQDPQNCFVLNAAPAYFDGGLVKMKDTGSFYFMSTRNHDFSNRDQKGTIIIDPLLPTWAVAVVVVGSALFVGSAGVAGAMFYSRSHPHSSVANVFSKF